MGYYYFYQTPIGKLYIVEKDNKICAISTKYNISKLEYTETNLIRNAYNELCEYFQGNRKIFDIPIMLEGTNFQLKVWNALLKIPYGEKKTYKDIAKIINNSMAYRAVGNACNKNPILIIIPCHRIIGSNNLLTGFVLGTGIKRKLLNIEAGLCIRN